MIIDTSAVMAILQREPEAVSLAAAIDGADSCSMSAVSVLEAGILTLCRKGEQGALQLDAFLAASAVDVVAFDAEQALLARGAFERYGKGRHRAGLNFGDCAAYALAAIRAEPLLCKGDDFRHTDLVLQLSGNV